ncbi:alpha/beta fold hydrolase [Xenophilus sp. Marseille-Q4582]|uniref:alpha/beta fold hydrolase n=1 Tax=Xenophilus sp. Marseille-Q4582 TaxID=2866600 RepID=UPI00272B4BE6|nr:alpha/beta hydrolase [Xenophilus sp. Marseille-Q4582]
MNTPLRPAIAPMGTDEAPAAQAHPDFGIPAQDPRPGAQQPRTPEEAERESQVPLVGGSAMVGAAAGAGIGGVVGGPIGVVLGGTLGGVAGALGAVATGNAVLPEPAAPENLHLHIEDSGGPGRPVVLIHGWPLSAQAWSAQTEALQTAGYRVVAYDRRGFGRSDKPAAHYDYDTLADDLERVMDELELQRVTLVGFSMGGGEVARYVARHGEERLHSLVFAAAVPPALLKTADNPDGPLTPEKAQAMKQGLEQDRDRFFEQFTRDFFSAHGELQVDDADRAQALAQCHQSAPHAALACTDAFARTDFREDLRQITRPTLVLHGDADAIVPLEGSGARTHQAVPHSQLVVIPGGPHGLNVSHAQAFNAALLDFLKR